MLADDGLGDVPQRQRRHTDRRGPQHELPAGLLGDGPQRSRLVRVAAARAERDAQDDEGNEKVKYSADREAGARGVLERRAVGCPVYRTVD